jgi:hypothetical protein
MAGCRETLISQTIGGKTAFFYAQCKCWTCENCAPWNADKLAQRIASGKPDKMLTLTIKQGKAGTPDDDARALVDALDILWKRFRKAFPKKKFAYVAVMERHKSGEPHLHLALRADYIPFPWLQKQMRQILESPRVRIEELRSIERGIEYLTGYMTKDPHKFKGCKRYWFSSNYEPHKDDSDAKLNKPDHQERWEGYSLADVREAATILAYTITKDSKARLEIEASNMEHIKCYLQLLRHKRAMQSRTRDATFANQSRETSSKNFTLH